MDKTDFERGKIIMFRMEIWVKKGMEDNKVEELKNHLSKEYGCPNVPVRDIKI